MESGRVLIGGRPEPEKLENPAVTDGGYSNDRVYLKHKAYV